MNNNKIWLSSPHMGGTEQKFVNEAFESNWISPMGPNVNGFEQDMDGNMYFLFSYLNSTRLIKHFTIFLYISNINCLEYHK